MLSVLVYLSGLSDSSPVAVAVVDEGGGRGVAAGGIQPAVGVPGELPIFAEIR